MRSLIIKTTSISLILCFCLPTALASAADSNNSCLENAMTQMEMNRCAGIDYTEADAELNRVYKQIIKIYSDNPAFIKNLKASQRAWIKLRDADFAMRYPHADDPSYYGSSFRTCSSLYLTELTLQRTAYLKQWLKGGEEGDLCNGSLKNQWLIQEQLKK